MRGDGLLSITGSTVADDRYRTALRSGCSLGTADRLMQAVYRLEERRTQNDDHDPVK